ncbi:tyrosine-protein phosphatase [Prauserella oleivorans]|uniref:Tyrosine-protein phosphatase n=1 Tax=Prauserella oleivorans TaxID=1478153 RepID=A0ABW5W5V9_9PSEU
MNRDLDWDGSHNARDLGGLPVAGGGTTRWGAVVRSEAPQRLTGEGWAALWDHGVRTIVDLRNDDEREGEAGAVPDSLDVVHAPLDPVGDDFWAHYRDTGLHATPLCYRPILDRRPDLVVAAAAAVARAKPGGVLVHCAGGRDRTGLLVLLLLRLAGVPAEVVADDYERSVIRQRPLWSALGWPDEAPLIADLLATHGTTARAALLEVAEKLDAEAYLFGHGLVPAEVAALRARLRG